MSKVTTGRQYLETEGEDYYRSEFLRNVREGDPDGEHDQYVPACIADELLACCEEALKWWHSDEPNDVGECVVARIRIKAIVAKAKGEEST